MRKEPKWALILGPRLLNLIRIGLGSLGRIWRKSRSTNTNQSNGASSSSGYTTGHGLSLSSGSNSLLFGFDLDDSHDVMRIDTVRSVYVTVLERNHKCIYTSMDELAHDLEEIRRVVLALLGVAEGRASSRI